MTSRTIRALASTTAAALAFGGLSLAGAPTAYAAPGDNGDVKIHKVGTPYGDPKDETRVCSFYLVAVGFDVLQQVSWEILPQAKVAAQLSGNISLEIGAGHTAPLTLPNGQYKLEWSFLGETGNARQKVFTVDCGGVGLPHKPPHGPVGAGGGGSAEIAADDSSAFGIGTAVAAGLAGLTGLVLIRRSRRRDDGAA
ncbi:MULTISPECIES: hypothetical protein [unclassified Streptomyces]|uniref:hypothetical protein n=1 Tax=unclassified Streptomyces TaxID=2593676 RepID=UPI001660CBE9|nr:MULTISPECIES: hypothetical protein [unclassified Streptomyces]MBD0710122.1 hypothetical protein [Streptomyces sp. CBMA291]MBD0713056.1 hypothetical protein [Streptomyces sp. CBMA370]